MLPHGAMVFDGGEGCSHAAAKRQQNLPGTLKDDCRTLFRATREAADMAKATKPDVIFLNSPHGISLSNSMCVYTNSNAKGNAEWNDQWMEYNVNVDLDAALAKSFVEHLLNDGVPTEELMAYTCSEAPLRWGEVIPLWFFRDLTTAGVKVVIFTNPLSKQREQSPLSEVMKVGRSIEKFISGLEQRVLYVVSGDLAHTHRTDCTMPLYLPDPRWNLPACDKALFFDLCVEHWVKCTPFSLESATGPAKTKEKSSCTWDGSTSTNAERWLSEATAIKKIALSCGIYELGVLHGILMAGVEKKASFNAHLFCRLAPTYYGMIVAAFIEK